MVQCQNMCFVVMGSDESTEVGAEGEISWTRVLELIVEYREDLSGRRGVEIKRGGPWKETA